MPATADLSAAPRSCLVVPGHQMRMHAKAFATAADEVVFDLEDAVPPAEKDAARSMVMALLADPGWQGRRVAVRINAPETDTHKLDLDAVLACGHPQLSVVVPKVEHPGQLHLVAAEGRRESMPVQALIESSRGLLNAHAIASHEAVVALIIGYADLAADLGRRPAPGMAEDWRAHQEGIVLAARAAGVGAIDGPFFRLRDAHGLANAATVARTSGFDGKWAIHPDQVPLINEVFAPTEVELLWAKQVLGALSSDGVGIVDGAMVDEAMSRRARRLLVLESRTADRGLGGRAASPGGPRRARRVGAPYYDDLNTGDVFRSPGLTITPGHSALHQSIVGDRLRLALDGPLTKAVTGHPGLLAHPVLVCDIAIGQSTTPSGRVLGNLFYRGLGCRPILIGSTLRTRTEVIARRDTSGGRGIAALRVTATNDAGEPVLDFWRCPLLPSRPGAPAPGAADDLSIVGERADPRDYLPTGWSLAPLREEPLGQLFSELRVGDLFEIESGETVTAAPELARMSLNLAKTHTDARASVYGERLVYGGHVIGIAAGHLTRALPDVATILVWHSCDHLSPTFEGDILTSQVEVTALEPLNDGGLVHLCIRSKAQTPGGIERDVLDWNLVTLMP